MTTLSLSIILATVTYYTVERIGRRYLRDALGVRRKGAPRRLRRAPASAMSHQTRG